MGKRISIKQKRREAPEWVFHWRRQPGNPALSKWLAVVVAGGLFALVLTAVRVSVSPPVKWAAPKAAVIYTNDDAEGRALAQRAREGGPFPSRFLPFEWEGAAAVEQTILEAARWTPPPYVPSLRGLPDAPPPPLRLAARGEPVLPTRRPASAATPVPVKTILVPVIYPLSGIQQSEFPMDLPPIPDRVDATMSTGTWRFLVRLDSSGHVWDCVSLADGDEAGTSLLEGWLRLLKFSSAPNEPSRWIAVGVGFANQPAADATDAR